MEQSLHSFAVKRKHPCEDGTFVINKHDIQKSKMVKFCDKPASLDCDNDQGTEGKSQQNIDRLGGVCCLLLCF